MLPTDWVWLHQETWSSVAWLYSKASDCLSFLQNLGRLNDIGKIPQDIIMQTQDELSKIMQSWGLFFLFVWICVFSEIKCYYICPGTAIILLHQRLSYSQPYRPWSFFVNTYGLGKKKSWNSKEYYFWLCVFIFQVTPYNLDSDKATSHENLQVRRQLAAVEDWNIIFNHDCGHALIQ